MTSATLIRDGVRLRVAEAMATSRSVIMPTTVPSGLKTGSTPQSFSYIALVTSARSSLTAQQTGSAVMMSRTFIAVTPFWRFGAWWNAEVCRE